MYELGMSNLLGVSYVRPNGAGWSAAVGPYVVDNPVVDSISGAKSATFRMNGGVFYDRNGSLMFSALYSARSDIARLNVNLYPGLVRVGAWKPGLWFQVPPRGGVRFGIVSRIGVGFGYGPDR